jgi:peptidoglycan L-alanyl-D-glutamate endopeptidase CwlK
VKSDTRARLRTLYPDFAIRAVRVLEDIWRLWRLEMRVTEAVRTWQYQEELYASGRTRPGKIVTHAKPGDSIHHYGLALDACFAGADPFLEKHPHGQEIWADFGRLVRAHGLDWGGDFIHLRDQPHAELTYGFKLHEIKELYRHGGLTAVWAAVDKHRKVPEGQGWMGPRTKVKMVAMGGIGP